MVLHHCGLIARLPGTPKQSLCTASLEAVAGMVPIADRWLGLTGLVVVLGRAWVLIHPTISPFGNLQTRSALCYDANVCFAPPVARIVPLELIARAWMPPWNPERYPRRVYRSLHWKQENIRFAVYLVCEKQGMLFIFSLLCKEKGWAKTTPQCQGNTSLHTGTNALVLAS